MNILHRNCSCLGMREFLNGSKKKSKEINWPAYFIFLVSLDKSKGKEIMTFIYTHWFIDNKVENNEIKILFLLLISFQMKARN